MRKCGRNSEDKFIRQSTSIRTPGRDISQGARAHWELGAARIIFCPTAPNRKTPRFLLAAIFHRRSLLATIWDALACGLSRCRGASATHAGDWTDGRVGATRLFDFIVLCLGARSHAAECKSKFVDERDADMGFQRGPPGLP